MREGRTSERGMVVGEEKAGSAKLCSSWLQGHFEGSVESVPSG